MKLSASVLTVIQQKFAGKLMAFTAVINGPDAGLGIACANEAGYSPVPLMAFSGSYEEAEVEAGRINDLLGLSENQVLDIVSSSVACGSVND